MKISVIIPMYNEEDNVLRTLVEVNRVLKDYDNYEILVVDDGSTDETFRLAEEFASDNSHVHVYKQPMNMGMGRALRTGFEKSDGDIIITIDADFSYKASHINLLASELLKDETVDIAVGSPYMEGGDVRDVPFLRLFNQ